MSKETTINTSIFVGWSRWALILTFLLNTSSSWAALNVFERKWSDKLPKVPKLASQKSTRGLSALPRLKWYAKKRQWGECLKLSEKQVIKKELQLWVAQQHLVCLREYIQASKQKRIAAALKYFDKVAPAKLLLLGSPYKGHKDVLVESFIDLADLAQVYRKDLVAGFLNRHQDLVDHMVDIQRSRYYRILGEMAWLKKENNLAIQNYLRSFDFSPSTVARKRLQELGAADQIAKVPAEEEIIYSDRENKKWKEFQTAVKAKRYQTMAKTGVAYLNSFPGSRRVSEVSEELLAALRKVVYRRSKQFAAIREDVVDQLAKAPGKFIMPWVRSIYGRGYYTETLQLAQEAADKFADTGDAAEALILAGKAAYFSAKWSEAEKNFRKLIEQYRGQDESYEAQYYLGLMLYRQGDYKELIPLYEKFLLSQGSDFWELQVRYWLWQALRKTKSPRQEEQVKVLLQKFPLTYYGLKVRSETQKSLQSLFNGKLGNPSVKYWFSNENKMRWGRIKKLLGYGWLEEAEREIAMLPSPITPEGHLLRAQLWHHANRSVRAMVELSMAIEKKPEFLTKEVLEMAFPREHLSVIEKYAGKREIDRDLILAVIRQESGFVEDAVSPSNAVGLMQLIRITANETAKWLRVKGYRWPDSLIEPDLNISFGSHYMSRMIRKYKGVVPLALGAYNVGPGNMDRWLGQRTDLAEWEKFGPNEIDDMWMDELPWGETSFYTKAILRNFILYKIIFKGEEKLSTPVWGDAQSIVPPGKAG